MAKNAITKDLKWHLWHKINFFYGKLGLFMVFMAIFVITWHAGLLNIATFEPLTLNNFASLRDKVN